MRLHQDVPFPVEVREAAVRRYLPTEVSYRRLAAEIGTSEWSLRDWVKRHQAGQVKPADEDSSRSTDERTPEEELRLLLKARALTDEQLGEFLRHEGHSGGRPGALGAAGARWLAEGAFKCGEEPENS